MTGTGARQIKPFVKVCESKVLRRSVVVCCGAKAELKKLFFDPKTFAGFALKPEEHRETWAYLEGEWDQTIGDPDNPALGVTTTYRGDVFILMPEWDSRVFVHEAFHAAHAVMRIIGTQDEELGAFLVEWLFEELCWHEQKGKRK